MTDRDKLDKNGRYIFTEEDYEEFNYYDDEVSTEVDKTYILYDPEVRMHLHTDGYHPSKHVEETHTLDEEETGDNFFANKCAYVTERDVSRAKLSEGDDVVIDRILEHYGGNREHETRAVKLFRRKGEICPWFMSYYEGACVHDSSPGSLDVYYKGESSMISAQALFGSYVCWLDSKGYSLPYVVNCNLSKIVACGKAIYEGQEGYGSICHMYYSFTRIQVDIPLPNIWRSIFNDRDRIGVVEDKKPDMTVDKIVYDVPRAEVMACAAAAVYGLHKSYGMEEGSPLVLGLGDCEGVIVTKPPCVMDIDVSNEIMYYGPFYPNMRARVVPVPWSSRARGLFICNAKYDVLTHEGFARSRKIFQHLMNYRHVGYVSGCSCANCMLELRYTKATLFGLQIEQYLGLFPGHSKGEGLPFIDAMLPSGERRISSAFSVYEFYSVTFGGGYVGVPDRVEMIGSTIGKVTVIDGIYLVHRAIVVRSVRNQHLNLMDFNGRKVHGFTMNIRRSNREDCQIEMAKLVAHTGFTFEYLRYSMDAGNYIVDTVFGNVGLSKPVRYLCRKKKMRYFLDDQRGYTIYQLRSLVDCRSQNQIDNNLEAVNSHKIILAELRYLKERKKVCTERCPNGEMLWRATSDYVHNFSVKRLKKRKTLLKNVPQIKGKGTRGGYYELGNYDRSKEKGKPIGMYDNVLIGGAKR